MKNLRWILALTVMLAMPSIGYANAGTPLMWATMFHLVLGNFFVGLVEGSLLAWWFKAKWWKAVLILIAANYVSAWAGVWALSMTSDWLVARMDITNVIKWVWLEVAAAFVLTLLVEWIFCWWALGKRDGRFKKSWLATLTVNLVTYALLVFLAYGVSRDSLITRTTLVPANELAAGHREMLYFINADDGKIMRSDLSGQTPLTVSELISQDNNERLYARRKNDKWNLYLGIVNNRRSCFEQEELIQADFATSAPEEWLDSDTNMPRFAWLNFGKVPRLEAAKSSPWRCETGFWAAEGVSCTNQDTEKQFRLALETPLAVWNIRNAVQLGGDLVVFQLGKDQICLLHIPTKRLALVTCGRGLLAAEPK